jgi:hypothetical protein
VLADAVGEAERVDAVDPSLEDRRHREPPQGKGEDQGVRPEKVRLLRRHVRRQGPGREGLGGGRGHVQARVGGQAREVGPINRALPPGRVEIGDADLVPVPM